MPAKLQVIPGKKLPRKFSVAGEKLWQSITNDYDNLEDDATSVEMLTSACIALDQAEACRKQIAAEGLMIEGRTGPIAHPLLKVEASARSFVTRILRQLDQRAQPHRGPGRPNIAYSWTGNHEEEE